MEHNHIRKSIPTPIKFHNFWWNVNQNAIKRKDGFFEILQKAEGYKTAISDNLLIKMQ